MASIAWAERPEVVGADELPQSLHASATRLHSELDEPVEHRASGGRVQVEESSQAEHRIISDNSTGEGASAATGGRASICYWLYFTSDRHNQGGCQLWERGLQEVATERERSTITKFAAITQILRDSADEAAMSGIINSRLWPAYDQVARFVSGDENKAAWIGRWQNRGHESNWDWPVFQIQHSGVLFLAIDKANQYIASGPPPAAHDDVDLSNDLKKAIEHNGMFRNLTSAQRGAVIAGNMVPPSWYGDLGRGEAEAMKLIDKLDKRACLQECIASSEGCGSARFQGCITDAERAYRVWLSALIATAKTELNSRGGSNSPVPTSSGGGGTASGDPDMIARGKEALASGRGMDRSIRELSRYVKIEPVPRDYVDAKLVLTALEAVGPPKNVHRKLDGAISEGERGLRSFKSNTDAAKSPMSSALRSLDEAIRLAEENIQGTHTQFYIFMRDKYNKAQKVRLELKAKMGVLDVRAKLMSAIGAATTFLKSGATYRHDLTKNLERALTDATPHKDDIHEFKSGEYLLERMQKLSELHESLTKSLDAARRCMQGGCDEVDIQAISKSLSQITQEAASRSLQPPLASMITEARELIRKLAEMVHCLKHLQGLVDQASRAVSAPGSQGNEGLGNSIGAELKKCDEFTHVRPDLYAEARRLKKTLLGLREARRGLESAMRQAGLAWRAGTVETDALNALNTALQEAQDYASELSSLIQEAQEPLTNLQSRHRARLNANKVVQAGNVALSQQRGEEQAVQNLDNSRKDCKVYGMALNDEIQAIDEITTRLWDIAQLRLVLRELKAGVEKAQTALRTGSGEDDALSDLLPVTFYAQKLDPQDRTLARLKGLVKLQIENARTKLDSLSRLSLKNRIKEKLKLATQQGQSAAGTGGDEKALGDLLPALEEYQRIIDGYLLVGTLKRAVSDPDAKNAMTVVEKLMVRVEARGISSSLNEVIPQISEAISSGSVASLAEAFKELYPRWVQSKEFTSQTGQSIPEHKTAYGYMKKLLDAILRVKYNYPRQTQ